MLAAASQVINLVGGLAFVVVGALLLYLRPARPGATAFAVFALAAGLQHAFGNLGAIFADEPYGAAIGIWRLPFILVAPMALTWATARLVGARALAWTAPFAIVAGVGALLLLLAPSQIVARNAFYQPAGEFLAAMPYLAVLAVASWLLCQRHAREGSPLLRRELRLLSLSTLPPLAYTAGYRLTLQLAGELDAGPVGRGYVALYTAALVTIGAIALRLAHAPEREARWLAWGSVGFVAVGVAQAMLTLGGFFEAYIAQLGGALRVFAALMLGYGLLKYRVLEIDLRVKNALAGTLAGGIVVMTFFIVSELASNFIADKTGSNAVGLGAAAILLVVEARVTRAGRRLAHRTFPEVTSGSGYLAGRREAVYRAAYESATRDGTIESLDRRVLETLAAELELDPNEVARIEGSVSRPTIAAGPVRTTS